MSKDVWIIAEEEDKRLKTVSYELLYRGRKLADRLEGNLKAVVIGQELTDEELNQLILRGADSVYAVGAPYYKHFIVENFCSQLVEMIRSYEPEIILAAATSLGRTLMPYAAARLKTGLTADCTNLDIEDGTGNLLQTRPAIGGNVLATIKTPDHRPQMATVRPRSSPAAEADNIRTGEIHRINFDGELFDGRTEWLGSSSEEKDGEVNIQEADIIIAGGRGLKKGENFSLLDEAARELNGSVAASREAVDRGWISYPHQVGLSGKTVSPRLYIAVGISGAIQHLAGMKTAETIIAVNNDPEAPIFRIADLGIEGDLFEILPRLVEKLKKEESTHEI